jgi:hypothetical protein
MYQISAARALKFVTPSYIPTQRVRSANNLIANTTDSSFQYDVEIAANTSGNGAIEVVHVTTAGSSYTFETGTVPKLFSHAQTVAVLLAAVQSDNEARSTTMSPLTSAAVGVKPNENESGTAPWSSVDGAADFHVTTEVQHCAALHTPPKQSVIGAVILSAVSPVHVCAAQAGAQHCSARHTFPEHAVDPAFSMFVVVPLQTKREHTGSVALYAATTSIAVSTPV